MSIKSLIEEKTPVKREVLVGFRSKKDFLRIQFGRGRIGMKDKIDALTFQRIAKKRKGIIQR